MGQNFTWTFIQCRHPFLGQIFWHISTCQWIQNMEILSHTETNIRITGIRLQYRSTGISTITYHSTEFLEIFNKYKYIMKHFKNTDNIKNETKHQIKTTGQSVFSHPWWLNPHKILQEGIIHPSENPYASLLHFVPKLFNKEFQPSVDFCKLIPIYMTLHSGYTDHVYFQRLI